MTKEFKHMITLHSGPAIVELTDPFQIDETEGILSVGVFLQIRVDDQPTHQFFLTLTELRILISEAQRAEINALKIGDDPSV